MFSNSRWETLKRVNRIIREDEPTEAFDGWVVRRLLAATRSTPLYYEATWTSDPGGPQVDYTVVIQPARSKWVIQRNGKVVRDTINEDSGDEDLSRITRSTLTLYSPLILFYLGEMPEVWGANNLVSAYPRQVTVADIDRYLRIVSYLGDDPYTAEEVFETVIDMQIPMIIYHLRYLVDCEDFVWEVDRIAELDDQFEMRREWKYRD